MRCCVASQRLVGHALGAYPPYIYIINTYNYPPLSDWKMYRVP